MGEHMQKEKEREKKKGGEKAWPNRKFESHQYKKNKAAQLTLLSMGKRGKQDFFILFGKLEGEMKFGIAPSNNACWANYQSVCLCVDPRKGRKDDKNKDEDEVRSAAIELKSINQKASPEPLPSHWQIGQKTGYSWHWKGIKMSKLCKLKN